MKKYLIAYMNRTIFYTETQRINTKVIGCDHVPTLVEALECVEPISSRGFGPKCQIIAISEIGGF